MTHFITIILFCIFRTQINYIIIMQYNPIPSSTGSETGSYHWFMTLMSRHKHMGEFLKTGDRPTEEILNEWAKDLFNTSDELITWYHNQASTPITLTIHPGVNDIQIINKRLEITEPCKQ